MSIQSFQIIGMLNVHLRKFKVTTCSLLASQLIDSSHGTISTDHGTALPKGKPTQWHIQKET
jgi:hypothetical protein